MIQRIQSVYLILVALAGILMYFFPVVSLVPSGAEAEPVIYHLSALKVETLLNGSSSLLMRYWPMVLLNALVIAFAALVVMQYKNRKKQITYTHMLLLLVLAQIVMIIYDVDLLLKVAGGAHMISYNAFSILPLLQILFTRLATSAIKKDEDLVRSADRLR
ncbi:MAG: DUF4293 domain-containing protein [Bacteroidia bacterium]|nr:DUF4293 domain-containing protein [Bacteroidia bacterium]